MTTIEHEPMLTEKGEPYPDLPLLRKGPGTRKGRPGIPRQPRVLGMTPRFWEQVTFDRTTGCATWTGRRLKGGYGLYRHLGKMRLVHRAVYEETNGTLTAGLTLDHLCGNTACVAVAHLEPVSLRENVQRAKRSITHCRKGHLFDERNTGRRRTTDARYCLACSRERTRAYKAADPDARRTYQRDKAREYRARAAAARVGEVL